MASRSPIFWLRALQGCQNNPFTPPLCPKTVQNVSSSPENRPFRPHSAQNSESISEFYREICGHRFTSPATAAARGGFDLFGVSGDTLHLLSSACLPALVETESQPQSVRVLAWPEALSVVLRLF